MQVGVLKKAAVSPSYLKELVNLGEVDPLLGVQLVDVAAVPVHQVEAEPHHLRVREVRGQHRVHRSGRQQHESGTPPCAALALSSMCFSLGVRYILFS